LSNADAYFDIECCRIEIAQQFPLSSCPVRHLFSTDGVRSEQSAGGVAHLAQIFPENCADADCLNLILFIHSAKFP
jgi:hypothetical protein